MNHPESTITAAPPYRLTAAEIAHNLLRACAEAGVSVADVFAAIKAQAQVEFSS